MFPVPFGENLPPGLDGVVESQALDTATIQEIADRLTIAVREDVSRDKTAVARLKTKLVKGVSTDMRLARADNLTPAAQRMRQAAEISLADDDAEIMRIAPRLNSYLPAESIPAPPVQPGRLPSPFSAGGAALPMGPPSQWGCDGAGFWSYPAGPMPDSPPPGPGVSPSGYAQAWDGGQGAWRWVNNRGQLPIQFALCRPAGPPAGPPRPAPPPPPPLPAPAPAPQPVCEPCPVGIPPGGSLPRVAICPVGIPEGTPSAAVYIVPWQYPGDPAPSSYSDCGKKLIADSLWRDFPAEEFAAALQDFTLLSDWLAFTSEPPADDDSPDEYEPILTGGYLQ